MEKKFGLNFQAFAILLLMESFRELIFIQNLSTENHLLKKLYF